METYYRMKPDVLSKLLAENDITQTDFADLVDIPQPMISLYGRGKINVPESRVKKMAEEFGVRIEDIADAVGRNRAKGPRRSSLLLLPGLRRCRFAAGFTQTELAAKVGVARTSIGAWETRGGRATRVNAHRLCKTLGVQLNDLTCADAKSEETHTEEPTPANASLSKLASALVDAVAEVKAENERLKATQKKWEEAFKVLGLAPIK